MPNHVINEVVLHGVSLDDCRKHILNADGKLDFGVLLPLPLHFWRGHVSTKHEKAFAGTQLDAARAIWGTKWGPYGGPTVESVGDDVVIQFQSAWSHPRSWVCALFNTLDCGITASWLSEGGYAGHVETYKPARDDFTGPEWDDVELAESSTEHRRLHKLLWGVEEFEGDDA